MAQFEPQGEFAGNTAVIGRSSTSPEGVVNKLNGLLGKNIQSPRDDLPGTVEVFDIWSIEIIRIGPESYYGAAVVRIGVRRETLDVEREFFRTIESEA